MSKQRQRQSSRGRRNETEAIRVDPRLIKALAHPMRVQIMAELGTPGRVTSPSKFATEHAVNLSKASYHFEQLKKFGCLDIVEERQVRGSTEHFYEASKRVLFHSDEWSGLPEIFKNSIAAQALSSFLKVSREAIEAAPSPPAMTPNSFGPRSVSMSWAGSRRSTSWLVPWRRSWLWKKSANRGSKPAPRRSMRRSVSVPSNRRASGRPSLPRRREMPRAMQNQFKRKLKKVETEESDLLHPRPC